MQSNDNEETTVCDLLCSAPRIDILKQHLSTRSGLTRREAEVTVADWIHRGLIECQPASGMVACDLGPIFDE
jgi:hypothetical protein